MKFPEWLPDRDVHDNPGLVECLNVIPDTYYKPIGDLVSNGTAMDAYGRGGYSMLDNDNVPFVFGGNETKLYEHISGDWSAVTSSLTSGTEDVWRFAQFGTICIATNQTSVVQKYDVAADSAFSALAGTPPQAKEVAVVGDFLVFANISTDAAKVQWSGINDITQWTAGTDESGSQTLPEGGPIRAIVGGEFGLIFQDHYITRMNYQGPPLNFSFDVIETGRGAISSGAVVQFGIYTYYLSHNGFYVTDGTQSIQISQNKVEQYFFGKFDEAFSHKITSVADHINKLIIWSYVGQDSPDGLPNWMIIYNFELQRWSEVSISHQLIFNGIAAGLTLEQLDTNYPDLDAMTTSLDSRAFKGGAESTYAIGTTNALATFTGDTLAGKLEMGEYELVPGQKSVLREVWPLIDGNITVTVCKRANYQSTPIKTGAIDVNTYGFAPFTENGRYHSIQFDFTDWTRANGFEIKSTQSGGF